MACADFRVRIAFRGGTASECTYRDHEEQRVDIADASWWCSGAPKYDAREQTYCDEIEIMEGDEVEGREADRNPGKSMGEGGRQVDGWASDCR